MDINFIIKMMILGMGLLTNYSINGKKKLEAVTKNPQSNRNDSGQESMIKLSTLPMPLPMKTARLLLNNQLITPFQSDPYVNYPVLPNPLLYRPFKSIPFAPNNLIQPEVNLEQLIARLQQLQSWPIINQRVPASISPPALLPQTNRVNSVLYFQQPTPTPTMTNVINPTLPAPNYPPPPPPQYAAPHPFLYSTALHDHAPRPPLPLISRASSDGHSWPQNSDQSSIKSQLPFHFLSSLLPLHLINHVPFHQPSSPDQLLSPPYLSSNPRVNQLLSELSHLNHHNSVPPETITSENNVPSSESNFGNGLNEPGMSEADFFLEEKKKENLNQNQNYLTDKPGLEDVWIDDRAKLLPISETGNKVSKIRNALNYQENLENQINLINLNRWLNYQ